MAYNEKRWAELRTKRKAGEKLADDERDEWDLLNAQRLIIQGRTRQQAVATRQRKRLNALRMELGTLVIEAGLGDMDRDRLRAGLAALAKHHRGNQQPGQGDPTGAALPGLGFGESR